MFDRLREEIISYLAAHDIGVLSMHDGHNTYALPVCYHSDGLYVSCWIPRWTDAAYYIEQPLPVVLVVPGSQDGACWLHYTGHATALSAADSGRVSYVRLPAFQTERYRIAQLTPRRIDLIDERQGWGWRQTLECWG